MNNKEKHLIVTEFFNNVIVFPVILIYFNVFFCSIHFVQKINNTDAKTLIFNLIINLIQKQLRLHYYFISAKWLVVIKIFYNADVLGSLIFFKFSSAFSSPMPTWHPKARRVL